MDLINAIADQPNEEPSILTTPQAVGYLLQRCCQSSASGLFALERISALGWRAGRRRRGGGAGNSFLLSLILISIFDFFLISFCFAFLAELGHPASYAGGDEDAGPWPLAETLRDSRNLSSSERRKRTVAVLPVPYFS